MIYSWPPDKGGEHVTVGGVRSTRRAGRLLLVGVAAVAVAVAVAIVVDAGDDTATVQDTATASQVEDRLVDVVTAINGTVEQRSAGAFMDHWAKTAAVKRCMADEGQRYRSPFIDPYAGSSDYSGLGDTWSEPLLSTAPSTRALAAARYQAAADRFAPYDSRYHWDAVSPEFRHAFNQCRQFMGHYRSQPMGATSALSELSVVVAAVSEPLGKEAEYDRCMLDAGYDVYQGDFGGPDAMQAMVQSQAPSLDIPVRELPRTVEWTEYLMYQEEVLAADHDCRVSKHTQLMNELAEPLDDFEGSYQKQLVKIEAEWQQIVAGAKSHGWAPPSTSAAQPT